MASVSVGLASVQNAQAICSGAIQDLNGSAERLTHRYNNAGAEWHDNKYDQLGSIVNDCVRAMRAPIDELFECLGKLQEIEKAIIAYESQNF